MSDTPPSVLKFAHVSDLHISTPKRSLFHRRFPGFGCATPDSMRKLQDAASRPVLHEPPNALAYCIASGDLTAIGARKEFEAALAYLQSTIPTVGLGLRYSALGVGYVLGNHDVWGGSVHQGTLLAARAKLQALADYQPVSAPRMFFQGRAYVDIGSVRVRAYGIDSTRTGFRNWLAAGRVSSGEMRRLQQAVEQDGATDRHEGVTHCFRIAVMHHPVFPQRDWSGNLEDPPYIATVLDAMHFGAVLCGHEHSQSLWQAPSGLLQCVAGSSTKGDDVHGFLLLTIKRDATTSDAIPLEVTSLQRTSGGTFGSGDPVRFDVRLATV